MVILSFSFFLFEKQLVLKFVHKQLFHFFNFFSGFFILLNPLAFFLVVNVPLAISRLMKCLHKQVLHCGLEDSHGVLVLILDDLVVCILLRFLGLWLLFLIVLVQNLSLFLYFEHFLGGLKDAFLDFINFVDDFPLLHAGLPGKISRIDVIGPQQNVQISEGKRSFGLIVNVYVPDFLVADLHFAIFVHLYYKSNREYSL